MEFKISTCIYTLYCIYIVYAYMHACKEKVKIRENEMFCFKSLLASKR